MYSACRHLLFFLLSHATADFKTSYLSLSLSLCVFSSFPQAASGSGDGRANGGLDMFMVADVDQDVGDWKTFLHFPVATQGVFQAAFSKMVEEGKPRFHLSLSLSLSLSLDELTMIIPLLLSCASVLFLLCFCFFVDDRENRAHYPSFGKERCWKEFYSKSHNRGKEAES